MRLNVAASICIANIRGSCKDTGGDWLGVPEVRMLWIRGRGREFPVDCCWFFLSGII